MKYCLFFLCFALLSCTGPDSTNKTSMSKIENKQKIETDKEAAKLLIQGAFDDLWGGVDSTKILKYHTEDFIILENGEVWDNERIKQFMREQLGNPDRPKRINIMDYISVEHYGESIQLAYQNTGEFYNQDSLAFIGKWLESAVAVETKDGWRLKLMHSTWNGK